MDDRGTHQIKGVPGEWSIFAVASVSGARRVLASLRLGVYVCDHVTAPPTGVGDYTQYGTRARYWRNANAATSQPTTVSATTTSQCRSS